MGVGVRIHIVARDHTSDQILARLAAQLAQHSAFTVGPMPDPRADLNLFAPYLEWERFKHFHSTKTAAWFSHPEPGNDLKARPWEECARAVDLRLVWTPLYEAELSAYGPTARVMPPLDRDFFTPGPRHSHERRVVGTSGFVYPGGRKGEQLIARLVSDFPEVDFRASGSGWPCPTTRYAWGDVPDFYRSLDVYVCTSLTEGIGYGPLEALACGIPVVIPRGVGVFDELPSLENLHRYTADDYASLKAALETALTRLAEGGYNPTSLRGATARYTVEAWQESHVEAIEHLLYDKPRYIPEHPWDGKACVFYVAYGDPARKLATCSIASFKKYMPGVPIVFVSDTPLDAGEDVFVYHEDSDIGARSVKTQMYDLAPQEYEFVLYLDADTELVGPVDFLYQILEDGWSVVIATNPGKYVTTANMRRPDNGIEVDETYKVMGHDDLLQLNGGVMGFRRSPSTAELFRAWHQEWQRYGARDQAALLRALYTKPIRVYVVGGVWNCITRYLDAKYGVILHYCMEARRWKGRIAGRLDSSEAWAAVHPSGTAKP